MANLGTGKILSTYMRPRLELLDKKDMDKRLEMFKGEKIGPTIWKLRTTKSYLVRNTWLTEVVIRKQSKYYICQIPTDKEGNITQINMAERLLDTEDGDRAGHNRNVMIDCSQDALKVAKPEDKAKTYYWYLYPNETDVKYIDDSHTKIVEILGKGGNTGEAVGRSSRILIVGGTDQERETIGRNIANNFTVREKRIIANCLIEIVGNNHNFAGCFQGHSDSKGNIIGVPKIQLTKSHVDTADVVVHEAIHALRQFDGSRDEKLRAVKHYFGRDADLEESLTEAETTGRERPFLRGDNYKAGYYHYIKIPQGDSKGMSWSEVRPGAVSLSGKNDTEHSYWIGETSHKDKYFVTYDRSSKHWIILDEMKSQYGFASYPTAEQAKKYAEAKFDPKPNKSSGAMVTEDRITITGAKEKGLKGKRVQKSILLKYPLTNIAHLKLKGTAEAIDTYYEVGNRLPGVKGEVKTNIHFYDPDATLASDKAQDNQLKAESGGEISQWQDGKRVQIQAGGKDQAAAPEPTKTKTNKGNTVFVETKENKGNIIIDGYSKAKTQKGALHDLAKIVRKYNPSEADSLLNNIDEAIANSGQRNKGTDYYIDLEKVPTASRLVDTKDGDQEMEYSEANYYFSISIPANSKHSPTGPERPTKEKPHKFGYYWDGDRLVYPGGTQLGRVHKVDDNTWYAISNGSVIGEHKTKDEALNHVTGNVSGEYTEAEKESIKGSKAEPAARISAKTPKFKRPSGSAGDPGNKPKKTKVTGGERFGPYFKRGGRLSRRPC